MMNFKECLNNYIKEYSISGKTLASQLNISEATMSRYRTGKNVPIKNSEFVKTFFFQYHKTKMHLPDRFLPNRDLLDIHFQN